MMAFGSFGAPVILRCEPCGALAPLGEPRRMGHGPYSSWLCNNGRRNLARAVCGQILNQHVTHIGARFQSCASAIWLKNYLAHAPQCLRHARFEYVEPGAT